MIDIRPIFANEAEAYVKVLCDTFSLDFRRVMSILFDPMFSDFYTKWALFDSGVVESILTTVPVSFGWGLGIGISGVATRESSRRKGYARQLLDTVHQTNENAGRPVALLFARDTRLYEDIGYVVVDDVVRASIKNIKIRRKVGPIETPSVHYLYNRWAEQDESRLIRDDERWKHWGWHLRTPTPCGDGYACVEGNVLREIIKSNQESLELPDRDIHWFGLRTIAESMGISLINPQRELIFMARNAPKPPQMLMTDQF